MFAVDKCNCALLLLAYILQAECPFIADVRGMGLFIGIEFVTDRNSLTHAPVLARWVKERAKARHVLLTTDGPYDNVVKIKPPMVFGRAEADHLVTTLRWVEPLKLMCGSCSFDLLCDPGAARALIWSVAWA